MFVSCLNFQYRASFFCFVNCHGKFASQVLLSQDALTFHSIIIFCYFQKTMVLQSHVPFRRTWTICEVVKTLAPIITKCILNQNDGHQLLGDTLQFIIFTCHELCDEIAHKIVLDSLVDIDAIIFYTMLEKLQICMKHQIPEVFFHFIYFLHGFDRRKSHQMLVFMLYLKFTNMHLITSYVHHKNATSLVANYESQLLLPLVVEFYKSLMLTISNSSFANGL